MYSCKKNTSRKNHYFGDLKTYFSSFLIFKWIYFGKKSPCFPPFPPHELLPCFSSPVPGPFDARVEYFCAFLAPMMEALLSPAPARPGPCKICKVGLSRFVVFLVDRPCQAHARTHTHTYIYRHVYIYMYVCMYMHMYNAYTYLFIYLCGMSTIDYCQTPTSVSFLVGYQYLSNP